ncbi:MAG: cobalt ECF transporter T component CbiQ [Candidatus Odinarchaeota archaeon]|nr:cobalt ECF transporter T component CbiQ [Candidatus Odinarchaeota archaeon]
MVGNELYLIDHWANNGDSTLHRMSALTKFIVSVLLVAAVISINSPIKLLLLMIVSLAMVLISRINLRILWKWILLPVYFALVISILMPFYTPGHVIGSVSIGPIKVAVTYEGIEASVKILLKAFTSTMVMLSLSSTTPFFKIVSLLRKVLPLIVLDILILFYRFVFIFSDEVINMMISQELRGFSNQGLLWKVKNLAYFTGTLLLESIDRAERTYLAMKLRGYTGKFNLYVSGTKVGLKDIIFLLLVFTFLSMLYLM